ncbi:MAG: OmpA family protein [Myxococcales bacterium]|nr:OmpA family protein [Myxococcales bacterium]
MSERTFRGLRRVLPTLAAAAVLSAGSAARAQTDGALQTGNGFDLRLFRQAVDSKGLVTVNGTDILGARAFSFGLMLDVGGGLARAGLQNGERTALVSSMFSGNLSANFGIGNLLVLGAQVPFHLVNGPGNTRPDDMTAGVGSLGLDLGEYRPQGSSLSHQGLGDIVLHAKLRWLRAEYFPVGLAVILQAGIPTFSGSRNFVGEPGPWVWPSVAIERRFGRRFRLAGNLGARIPFASGSTLTPAQGQGSAVTYGPSLTFGVGVSYRLINVIDLMAETYGAQYFSGFGNGNAIPVEGILGAKIFVDRNSYLTVGAGTGLTGALAASTVRGFIGMTLEPSIGDTDGDGYRDDVDRCVVEPEDFDNFEDDDGCPDPDNDRDGILDTDDQCPLVPEDRNGQQDSDGCPDSDVQDRDGDQIADNVDQCPDDPEDRDGFEDDNGCPDPDNDQDQILDTDDLCPNEPEDRDGFEDDNGCPDPDNDRDTIPDVRDQCPNDAEVFNGLDDADGCPDNGVLRRVGTEIQLNQQINFATDSAEIIDNDVNRNILEQMASLLNNNPDIEMVEVEGHTDERAADDHNLELSRNRAQSVMQALVSRGVAATRLVSAGYGEFCPLDPRSNEEAWARNRRVQFFIIRTTVDGRTTASAGCARGRQYIPPSVGAPRRAESQ